MLEVCPAGQGIMQYSFWDYLCKKIGKLRLDGTGDVQEWKANTVE